jgi:hypothetical protein
MLHLDPRIDLDKIEVQLLVQQKFNRPGVDISHSSSNCQSSLTEFLAFLFIQMERGGDFDNFLVPPLNGTIPLVKMNQIAMRITKDLDLEMFGFFDVFFQKNISVTKGSKGLGCSTLEPFQQFFLVVGHAHAPPAASGTGFDDDRVAGAFCEKQSLLLSRDRFLRARNSWNARFQGNLAAGYFIAETSLNIRCRPDKCDSGTLTGFGKISIFRKKTVARMDRVDILLARQVDNLIDPQIGFDRPLPLAHQISLVSLVAMQRQAILLRIDGDRGNPQFGTSPKYPDSNLAAIRRHNFSEFFNSHQKLLDKKCLNIKYG